MNDEKTSNSLKSVQIALDVLEAITQANDDMGVSEIAAKLGLPKGSIFRYVKTLTDRGYLTQSPITSRYGLGMRLHVLGEVASHRIDLLSASEPVMLQLRDDLMLTVNLVGVIPTGTVVLRSMIGSLAKVEIGVRVGTELPFNSTSQGKVILAFSKRRSISSMRRQKLEKFTDFTITDWATLEQEVKLTRSRGWGLAIQETVLGINGMSVPILDATGECIAALTLVGSMQFVHPHPDPAQLAALSNAGRRISADLGFHGHYPTPR